MIWITMIISGLLTFAARFSMIGMFKDRAIPDVMRKLLTYVAPSALAAIILPDVLLPMLCCWLVSGPQTASIDHC